jgi:hypothetical protein
MDDTFPRHVDPLYDDLQHRPRYGYGGLVEDQRCCFQGS